MGNWYDIIYCKESTNGDTVMIKRRSLNNRYDPVEIEPLYLTLKEVGHVWESNGCHNYAGVDCDGIRNHRLAGLRFCQLDDYRHYEPDISGIRKKDPL